jgi:putative hydrolase of the HAD superfamily
MAIKAVLFDLGGTLIKTADVPTIYQRILRSCQINIVPSQIKEAHDANGKELDVANGMIEFGESFWSKIWNPRMLRRLGITENIDFIASKIDELWWDCSDLQFYPDVMDTIFKLRAKGIKTGIVTNALKKDYETILQMLEASSYFDVVVGIDACSRAKPDREIFMHAARQLRLKPDQVLFVGDLVEKDYEGARKAGLKALLIDRERKNSRNTDSIGTLTEILHHV